MGINAIITYIVLPIIMSFLVIKTKNKKTFNNMVLTKGIYYFIMAIFMILNTIFNVDLLDSEVYCFTLAIAIMEGGYAIRQGIDGLKDNDKD